MNKRQIKKIKDKEDRKSALAVIKNLKGSYKMYISKRYWNKGDKNKIGFMTHIPTGDFISSDYILKFGFDYICLVQECESIELEILRSWDNKNHLVRL